MRILVTGASGFLGKALLPALQARGHEAEGFSSAECDLRQPHGLDAYNARRYDCIYHLAAWTQAGDFCLFHPGEQWIINQQINTNVLAWWQRRQPQAKLIAIGTSCAYAPTAPLAEENYLAGAPIESLFTYAMTKRMLYIGLLALQKQYGLRHLCLVPSTLYGPGYHTDGRQMHFIFDLIRKIIGGKTRGSPVVLWGDGRQTRELVYIGDFVTAAISLADRHENDLVNIGAGGEHSIRDFARMICDHVGYDLADVQFDTSKYVGARSKRLEIDKLRRLMPDYSPTPLATGLKNTVDWFWENRQKLL